MECQYQYFLASFGDYAIRVGQYIAATCFNLFISPGDSLQLNKLGVNTEYRPEGEFSLHATKKLANSLLLIYFIIFINELHHTRHQTR